MILAVSLTQIATQTLGDYVFPFWTLVLGQTMTCSVLLGIILWPIYAIIDARFFKKRSFKSLFVPDFEAFQPKNEASKLIVANSRNPVNEEIKEPIQNLVS